MNRLVRDHYPVSKLPEDLREGFEGQVDVRVTIDLAETSVPPRQKSLQELFAMGRPTFNTVEEIDDHLQTLREEWD